MSGSRPTTLGLPITRRALQAVRAAADLTAIVVAFVACYQLYTWAIHQGVLQRGVQQPEAYLVIGAVYGGLALLAFAGLGLYRERASVLNLWECEAALKGLALAAACFFAALFLLRLEGYSRLVVVGAMALAAGMVLLERRVLSALIRWLQLAGRLGRRVLIYGCGETGRLVLKKIIQSPNVGCTVVGFLDDLVDENAYVECRVAQGGPSLRVPVLGRVDALSVLAATRGVDELLVTAGTGSPEQMREVIELAARCGVAVAVVPRLGDLRVHDLRVEDLGAVPLLRLRRVRGGRLRLFVKRAFDLAGAVALGIATLPLWAAAWALLRFEGAGPVFFVHERVGLEGRRFRLLKFRTMRADTHPQAPSPQDNHDPRITRVGGLLRLTGLDELPQLINVLRGDMSLVGPRPEMPFIVEGYGPLELERLRVKPGITGLWQISADRQAEIHENIEYDLHYVSHQSLVLDVLILLETTFFTAGLVLRALSGRWAQGRARKAAVASRPAPHQVSGSGSGDASRGVPAPLASGRYVLVALDQRRNGDLPITWQHSIPVATTLARRWPVKVLTAASNRAVFDQMFADVDRGEDWEERHTTYASYRTRAELRELTLGARLVLTDLPHVAEWAQGAGVALVWASESGISWAHRGRDGDTVEADLSESIDAFVAPEVAVP